MLNHRMLAFMVASTLHLTPALALETITTEASVSPRERAWYGVVEAVNEATLSAQTSGRVEALPYDVHDLVPAGAVVVRFTDIEQQSALRGAQAALRTAQAQRDQVEKDFARVQALYNRHLVAKSDFDAATARRASANAAVDAAQSAVRTAEQQVDYTVVKSPYSGIVTQRHVRVGESVHMGQPLISGLSLGELRVQVEVPQSAVADIQHFDKARVEIEDGGHRDIQASRITLVPFANPESHSFKMRVDLPAQETGLYPGMTVRVAFVVGTQKIIQLPRSSILRQGEVSAVYVKDGESFKLRYVRTGIETDERVQILSGLGAGETVAVIASEVESRSGGQ